MNKEKIKEGFMERANGINQHDPWRYGHELSGVLDEIEIEYIRRSITGKETLLDLGCGTGRHAIRLASNFDEIYACDFAKGNISFLNSELSKQNIKNVSTSVCDATEFDKFVCEKKFDKIIGIGLTQYIPDNELNLLSKKISNSLNQNGSLMLKVPVSFTGKTFTYFGERDGCTYISKYRTLDDSISNFLGEFDLYSVNRLFTRENLGDEYGIVEKTNDVKQMLIVLKITEKLG